MISAIGGISSLESLSAVYEISSYSPARRTAKSEKPEPRIPEDTIQISDAAVAAFDRTSLKPIAPVGQEPKNRNNESDENAETSETAGMITDDSEIAERIKQYSLNAESTEKTGNVSDTDESDKTTESKKYEDLSEEEKKQVDELKQRDAEVKAHEQAHLSAAGDLANGGAQFSYQTGPDGTRYAVGGEVSIETSKGKTPEETIQRAARIRQAAMAPAEPSGQDRSVAAKADQMKAEASAQMQKEATQNSAGSAKTEEYGRDNEASESSETDAMERAEGENEKTGETAGNNETESAVLPPDNGLFANTGIKNITPEDTARNSADSKPDSDAQQYQNTRQSLDFVKAFNAYSQAFSMNTAKTSSFSFAA